MMSGISSDMTMILWLSALVSAVNFFASFLGSFDDLFLEQS